jgi:hypothetical protein
MDRTQQHDDPTSGRGKWVLLGFLLIAGFFLFTEHRAHLLGFLPYLVFLACPLMHFFHHGHGRHGGADASKSGNTVRSQEAAKELP